MIQKTIIKPFQKFVKIESLSGLLLFGATLLALIWANSTYSDSYFHLWQQKIGFKFSEFELIKPLILWINDGLMAVFFFLIGLEIKREVLIGELNSFKKASFPLLAALGGMIIPMAIYLWMNQNPETESGWGIPMATDIAFSLAIIKLLGKRVPLGLKVFLTAFAIVDDLGAVLVIAIFYSSQLNIMLLVYAFIILGVLFLLSYLRFYSKYLYFILGVVVWFLFLKSGIHPTIAGVLLAFTIPVSRKVDETIFTTKLNEISETFNELADDKPTTLSKEQIECIDELESWTDKIQSPLQHLEHKLHDWVAYIIMPIFAIANAGVVINSSIQFEFSLVFTLIASLIVGKLLGILIFTFIGLKMKWIELPEGINNWHLTGVGLLAGVGFTMSIFIANLAFVNPSHLDSAKVGILIGSTLAGLLGYVVLRWKSDTIYEE